MKKSVLLIALSLNAFLGNAQTSIERIYKETAFNFQPMGTMIGSDTEVIFHDNAAFVKQTLDGGYIAIGNETNPVTLESNTMLLKINENGRVAWEKKFGGAGNDFSRSGIQTADSGYVLAGGTNTIGAGGMDVQLIKTDSLGNEIWTKTFGGSGDEEGASVQKTNDGGYIILGRTNSFGAGAEDVYLLKTDADGNLVWSKTYGGAAVDIGNSVKQTADGGYFITGKTQSFGAGNWDVYMIRTDANGNEIWAKTVGGTEADIAQAAVETAEGEFVVAGSTGSFGDMDVYMIKVSGNGDMIWSKTFGGIEADKANSIQQTMDGGYIIAGETMSFGAGNADVYLIKTSSGGSADWTKTYGTAGNDYAAWVEQTADGGYITIGSSVADNGSEGFYLIRSDDNGNTECNHTTTTTIITTVVSPFSIVSSTVTDPSVTSGSFLTFSDSNNFLGGDVLCVPAEPSEPTDPEMVTFTGVENMIDSTSNAGNYVAKSLFADNNKQVTVNVYPNPSAGQFNFSGLSGDSKIEIYSISGELILQEQTSNEAYMIDLTGKSKGFYFYKITGGDAQISQSKILIQ